MDFDSKSDFQQMLREEIWPEVSEIYVHWQAHNKEKSLEHFDRV